MIKVSLSKEEKIDAYRNNMKILPLIFTFLNTPIYFFSTIYIYTITGSYLVIGATSMFKEGIKILMEIPTGVLSDKYLGRRGTEIAANASHLIGIIFYILAASDWRLLFVGEVFIGVALAFYSGNTTSLLYDTLAIAKKEKHYHRILAKFHQYSYLQWSFSILFSGIVSHYFHVKYFLFYCVIERTISLFLSLNLKEVNLHKGTEERTFKNSINHFRTAFKNLKKNTRLKWLVLINSMRYGFDALEQLTQVFYKSILSFFSLGFLISGSLFICNFSAKYSEKIASKLGFFKTYSYIKLISVPMQVLAYIFPGIHSPILIELGQDLNPIEYTAQTALMHKEFSDKERATMDSLVSLIGSFFYASSAMVLGFMADNIGLINTLLIGTLTKLTIIPMAHKVFRK